MKFDSVQILDILPEPVLLMRDGLVAYHNPAAAAMLPGLAMGAECPPPVSFALPLHGLSGAAVCELGGKKYVVSTTVTPEVTVVAMCPAPHESDGGASWVPAFTEQLRAQMAGLMAAVQQLESARHDPDSTLHDKWLAILNQNAYRLLRATGAAELRHQLTQENAYHPGTMDLAGLCLSLRGEVTPIARQMNLNFTCESQVDSLLISGDYRLLRAMLLGLVSNAIKAVAPGGSLGLRLTVRNSRALLTVWDDGVGMDERSLGMLFRDEWSGAVPRPGEGMHLGLFNARTIAGLHGGVLVVESSQGTGARFTVSLPIQPPDRLPLRTPILRQDSSGGFSALLVELSDALPWRIFLPDELE